jgi:hypothetical protein
MSTEPNEIPAQDAAPAPETAIAEASVTVDGAAAAVIAAPAAEAASPTAAPAAPGRTMKRLNVAAHRTMRFALGVALLALGFAVGWDVYIINRPAPAVIGDPTVVGQPAPAIVEEFANAVASGDSDAIRSALPQEMFARYTSEMQRFGIASISDVETLGTYTDGPRTATALMLFGTTIDRNPFAINLVVVTQNGLIVRLR